MPHRAGHQFAEAESTLIRPVNVPRRVQHRHFNIICNPLLWSLHHGIWNPAYAPLIDREVEDAWERGYVEVNQACAEAVVAEAGGKPAAVLVRDFQFYLVSGMVRASLPDAVVHFKLDLPFPDPSWWRLLPVRWRERIFESLIACDVVGFSSAADARRFSQAAEEFAPGAALPPARVYAPPLNAAQVQQIARSPKVREHAAQLAAREGVHTVVRVERAEPHKNIVRTIRAFTLLMERRPELAGKVRLLLVLAPPAPHFSQFRRYADEVRQAAEEAARALNRGGVSAIELHLENNYPKALAALSVYDTLVVTPLADASATSAREGPAVNLRDGVVVMSDGAGPWERLREHVLTVSASDVSGLAEAMAAAVSMPLERRRAMAAGLRDALAAETPAAGAERLIDDLLAAGA
jgi:trehalose 6-phosphate synthase